MSTNADWLDSMLSAPSIDDEGFTERVEHVIAPSPHAWRAPLTAAAVVVGAVAVTISLRLAVNDSDDVDVQSILRPFVDVITAACAAAAVIAVGVAARVRRPQRLQLTGGVSSGAAVPALDASLRRPTVMTTRLEDLDEVTVREVVRIARGERALFGAVMGFFLAVPMVWMLLQNLGLIGVDIESGQVVAALRAVFGGAVLVGAPVVIVTSRLAFVKECEQLGIGTGLAHALRTRLTIANILYSPVEERDDRAVAFLLGGWRGLRAVVAQKQLKKRLEMKDTPRLDG